MQSKPLTSLILAALCVGASSCGNRVETLRTFPPAEDLQSKIEPAYPVEALDPGPAGEAAEAVWWNRVLIWGRGEHAKVKRICNWATDLGLEAPKDFCEPR